MSEFEERYSPLSEEQLERIQASMARNKRCGRHIIPMPAAKFYRPDNNKDRCK